MTDKHNIKDIRFISIGELLLRLSPPNNDKIRMANQFNITYGGAEANIAVSLANLGVDASYFTVVPDSSIGKAAIRYIRSNDVHCSPCIYSDKGRMGMYYLEEGFGAHQKGSSAMPHKKNPVLCENLCGLARVVRSNMLAAFENINLWHERDISHSSAERIIFPDSLILIDFMLHRFKGVMENLVVHEDNMLKNTKLYGGVVYSQKVMLKLVDKGFTREDAYRIVQKHALEALNGGDFRKGLESENLLTNAELDECFDTKAYLENIDKVFARFER